MKQIKALFVGILMLFMHSAFSQGNEEYNGPIIDMHLHAFGENSGFETMLGQPMPNPLTGKVYNAPATLDEVKAQTLKKMKEHNIVRAMLSGARNWPDADPAVFWKGQGHSSPVAELRQMHSAGELDVIGEVAPNYAGMTPTAPVLAQYYDVAEELNVPMAYHLFPGGPPGGAYMMYPETRAAHGKPLVMEDILLSHRNMRIYIMHAGWPYLEDMKALMYAHPQVYVDTGVIAWILPRAEFHKFIKGLVDAGFGKRIMFGSDQMVWAETITDSIDAINSMDFLTVEQKADIFYNNALRFMNAK
ncbi:amidohydrolase family protein [Fulvivirga sedimenti]|uniref:Amidohydrolase family protein n=1 Tax=Fulvivirga sedimenti TaxID=2879465 RepID=A0A9X1KX86_9BACT|nr:amidohydrolase family protein [Fulvivirga sedimenti]MCA6075605.1 amidohydrolase family protein [Fulvivirga sedimenti]